MDSFKAWKLRMDHCKNDKFSGKGFLTSLWAFNVTEIRSRVFDPMIMSSPERTGFKVPQKQIDSPKHYDARLLSDITAKRYYNPRRLKYHDGVCNADQHRDRMQCFEFTWIGKRTVNEVCLIVIWYNNSWRTYPWVCIKFMPEVLIAIERARPLYWSI